MAKEELELPDTPWGWLVIRADAFAKSDGEYRRLQGWHKLREKTGRLSEADVRALAEARHNWQEAYKHLVTTVAECEAMREARG